MGNKQGDAGRAGEASPSQSVMPFETGEPSGGTSVGSPRGGKVRVVEPTRNQGVIRFEIPEDGLPPTHAARVLWDVVGTLDLAKFLGKIKAIEGERGRSATSPRLLLTLWLYAITRGIGSAREIARCTRSDAAFVWLVGNVNVSRDVLGDFRIGHGEALNAVMTDILASLMSKGVLSLELVAQDGIRIRASATAPSFRTYGSLLECREQAALHLKAVLAQTDDPELTAAQKAAREHGARDFQRRVEEAITTVQELQSARLPSDDKMPRASTTDAEARVMKVADGGFRPAYNVQMATAGEAEGGPRTIIAVQVTNVGSDMGSVTPMLAQIEQRTGQLPDKLLADANHAKHDDIRNGESQGVEMLIAPPKNAKALEPDADPTDGVVKWRQRMETEEGKRTYRARASLCELTNAHFREHHGVDQFLVRGLDKVLCVVYLAAIASNIMQHATTLLSG